MDAVAFAKYEGLGNDFVLVEAAHESAVSRERAVAICDRRLGVGADGVLLLLPASSQGHAARMRVLNADGSVPEMCGNGIRCAALHLARARGVARGELVFETDAGPRTCAVEDGPVAVVSVDMGVMRIDGDVTLDLDGESLSLTRVDAGNPHAVTFSHSSRAEALRLGPAVSSHPTFPRGTNVELAVMRSGGIDLIVWERGVGLTLACGTGACATAAAACARGLAPFGRDLDVRLPGGTLVVSVARESMRATMRGPARHVFSGTLA